MIFLLLLLPFSAFAIIFSHDRPKKQWLFVISLTLFGFILGLIGYSIFDNYINSLNGGEINKFELGGTFALGILTGTAVLLAIWSGYEQRNYFRKSVKPIIVFRADYNSSNENGIRICNSGLGPAVIRSIKIFRNGSDFSGSNNTERWEKFEKDINVVFPKLVNSLKMIEGTIISPKDEAEDLIYCYHELNESQVKSFIDYLTLLEIEINYSDIYGREQPSSNFSGKFFPQEINKQEPTN